MDEGSTAIGESGSTLQERPPLPTRALGRTGLTPTNLTLGTWGLADGAYGPSERPVLEAVVREALALGIRSFDVAPLWGDGLAEEVVGAAIRERRDECLVVTRAGALRKGGEVVRLFDPPSLEGSIDASRRRLGVDVIDVLLLHDPPEKILGMGAFAKALAGVQARGAVRAWGLSTASVECARIALGFGARVLCVPHNLVAPDLVPAIAEEAERAGAGLLVRSTLSYGLLTEAGVARESYPAGDHRAARWTADALSARRTQANGFSVVWTQKTPSLQAFALRWALGTPTVASACIGPRSPEQLRALVASVTPVDHLDPGLHERTSQLAAVLGI